MNYPAPPQFPGYPGQPQQQFPPAPPAPQQYGQPYPQQAYPAPAGAPQTPAGPPPVNGTLDDFYNQPSTGGGPSISWKGKPIGTAYAGIVSRDVTSADVQQQINFQTKQPEFYRDGRPKFVMKVPLRVQPSQEFPDGEAVFYVRGQARDELVRAMAEAGVDGAPKAGAGVLITLVQRKPSGQGMNPSNVVQIQYTPPQGQAPSAAPVAEAPAPQPAQQQQPSAGAPSPTPAPVQAAAPQPPSDLSPEQQALLARISGQQQSA